MFVNNGLVGVFNATELIYAVYKANKGGLDSLDELYVNNGAQCSLSFSIVFYFVLILQYSSEADIVL